MKGIASRVRVLNKKQRGQLTCPYVPITRRTILELEDGEFTQPDWMIRQTINTARVIAVNSTAIAPITFTHESALIIHGIGQWEKNPPVTVRSQARIRPIELCQILTPRGIIEARTRQCTFMSVPASTLMSVAPRRIVVGPPTVPSVSRSDAGAHAFDDRSNGVDHCLYVDSCEETAVLMALTRPGLHAFVAVSQILRSLSRFNRFDMKDSLRREKEVREQLLARLDEYEAHRQRLRNGKQARTIMTSASGLFESVGECVLAAVLLTLFPQSMRPQLRIRGDRGVYFADFAFPEFRIVIEFDGVAKMGRTEGEFIRATHKQMERQTDIENQGYKVFHVNWNDLLSPDVLRDRLLAWILTVAPQAGVPRGRALEYAAIFLR
ncbi:hypothetical protein [Schaalia sp. ZJ1691]|uniref:hypothetical protein n=1 Tax=Schaalia sp. ZJ1691 TaxID=2709404 RepID=UPI0013EA34FA|nr:hypothetical protein [Schaalia sp. ZJ1691]